MSAKGPENDDPKTMHAGISDTASRTIVSKSVYALAPQAGKHTTFEGTQGGSVRIRGLKKTSVPSRPGNRRSVVGVNHLIPDERNDSSDTTIVTFPLHAHEKYVTRSIIDL
jgi:hypothetical protein